MTTMVLRDEVAWISGGSSGIGLATASRLQALGARVAVLDVVASTDPNVAFAECDISSAAAVAEAARTLEGELGPPTILVACAAITGSAALSEFPDDLWRRLLDVNLTGTFQLVRKVFAGMCARRRGRIVLFSSDAAARPLSGHAGYAATKAAVIALGRVAATEGGPYGVTCNVISPGVVDTPAARRRWDSRDQLVHAVQNSPIRNLLGVVLDADDIAEAVAFLVSPASRHVTGQTLHVNAGGHLH
ncbi:SDR family NAD(P)-dependent oxidoreductase [Dactylosporangium sucinum]|uniref:Beta-ketoacyl-ACP reductase n=1 Tax=Dactylosporangium sucinum TaxID=1424081 RepID=A0A917U7T2_9ACTN|nr:SDR family oxidoreductase [Dactylosporangium sucinum]GGM64856.1 beta-ketoacyl-ACP reductase [Dactylosporangium sucinum]